MGRETRTISSHDTFVFCALVVAQISKIDSEIPGFANSKKRSQLTGPLSGEYQLNLPIILGRLLWTVTYLILHHRPKLPQLGTSALFSRDFAEKKHMMLQ